MSYLPDAEIDALIREDEERRAGRGNISIAELFSVPTPPAVKPPTPPPPKKKLRGLICEMLPVEDEEFLCDEYDELARSPNDMDRWVGHHRDPPPPHYSGPVLTLKSWGPYTRFEVLSSLPPVPPRFDGKKKVCNRSRHYPRPALPKCNKSLDQKKQSNSLWLWKRSMGFLSEENRSTGVTENQ
ncbi:uncharacterized protein TEOVI_000447800 [Trypanosoma equiperdum]|uniref:Uncharacterized protein n=3 Tax=Trypanozoon TaxID=39700 RepID=Q38DJ0_TRYB2|nr:hypothetical protein, conserved [Trypanosoma brucei brucei TREU927]EAN77130.1 hypothetical protein, conserved [Trypanosoma brucei brucei TREU927]RHW70572.1 hypothetical protein DPX39_090071300 [Trypanosoma brucei equiperdum]SCU72894.1 hypothetical protein, conserved [Trypanosoma equiperdum]